MNQNRSDRVDLDTIDAPSLSKVLERNIRTILRLRLKADRGRALQDQIADAITSFSGRLIFVYVHIVWFGAWILLNTGRLLVLKYINRGFLLLLLVEPL